MYILLAISALIFLVLALRVNINIKYEDELTVYLRVLFVKIKLFPQNDKGFNAKKYDKKQKKNQDKPDVVLKEKSVADKEKDELYQRILTVTETVKAFFTAFSKYLHVKLAKIHVTVATPDAAKTAILYGAVSGATACLLDLLDEITNLDKVKNSSIVIEPDFVAQKSDVRINITLYMSILGALITLVKTLLKYINLKYIKPKGN